MYLVSLSQPHDAAFVLDLSQCLEHDHEVRRAVTLQVMDWFGEVDDAGERWKMDVEQVVRQVGLGILRQHKVRDEQFRSYPIDPNCSRNYFLADRPNIGGRVPDKMEYRRGRYVRFPHIPQVAHGKHPFCLGSNSPLIHITND